jgi:hypothetical protein
MVLARDVHQDENDDDNNTTNKSQQFMEKVSIDQLKEIRKNGLTALNWDFDTDLTA